VFDLLLHLLRNRERMVRLSSGLRVRCWKTRASSRLADHLLPRTRVWAG
jgi:hypothetical protein